MTLSVAISILVRPRLAMQQRIYVHELLKYFVKQGRNLYGVEFLVYNVHSLLHLAELLVVRHFGCLDTCGSFPFENYLQVIKTVLPERSPIFQITKRIGKIENTFEINTDELEADDFTKKPNNVYVLWCISCTM